MDTDTRAVLSAFPLSGIIRIEPYGIGHIHETFLIEAHEGIFVLQKMSPAVPPAVIDDMHNVSEHLAAHGIVTPKIVSTRTNTLTCQHKNAHWRLMTFINGFAIENNPTMEQAKSAGETVAHFHVALTDFKKPFSYRVPQVQNPPLAFQMLEAAAAECKDNTKNAECRPLVEIILAQKSMATKLEGLPLRPLHGDPKLSNILFDEERRHALALIDLDTLGLYRLPLELGDMLRSFCTERKDWSFSTEIWKAALEGYFSVAVFVTDEERSALPDGFELITLSLAARYLTDAYEEKFFSLDVKNYTSLYEQNFSRARSYLHLLEDFRKKREHIS